MSSHDGTILLLSVLPFIASLLLGLSSPAIAYYFRMNIRRHATGKLGMPEGLTSDMIDYSRQTSGIVRMTSAFILTTTSGVVYIVRSVSTLRTALLLCITVTVIGYILLMVLYTKDPYKYATRGFCGYYLDSFYIIAVNLLFLFVATYLQV